MAGSAEMAGDDHARRRRGRNIAIFLALAGLAILFYALAMVKFAATTHHALH